MTTRILNKIPAFFRPRRPPRPSPLQDLLDRNKRWAREAAEREPDYFSGHLLSQQPDLLWIGCSDSRVPANQVVDLPPGKVFVHRNIANVISHSDLNCLSVIEYAVAVLKVKHIVVCGHYGCGGVACALGERRVGLIDNWLRHIRDVREKHNDILTRPWVNDEARMDMLCELNVIEQVQHVSSTTIVQAAWEQGHELNVHGWIYRLRDGIIKDLGVCVSRCEDVSDVYRTAMADVDDEEGSNLENKEAIKSQGNEG